MRHHLIHCLSFSSGINKAGCMPRGETLITRMPQVCGVRLLYGSDYFIRHDQKQPFYITRVCSLRSPLAVQHTALHKVRPGIQFIISWKLDPSLYSACSRGYIHIYISHSGDIRPYGTLEISSPRKFWITYGEAGEICWNTSTFGEFGFTWRYTWNKRTHVTGYFVSKKDHFPKSFQSYSENYF